MQNNQGDALRWLAVSAAMLSGIGPALADDQATVELAPVVVTGSRPASAAAAHRIGEADIDARRAQTSDTASLLQDIAGAQVNSAGGVSGLPTIHGLADDRIRTQVQGMDLMPACPNHMNPALSYIDPSQVAQIKVFAGVAPVSVAGDSIGGAIEVQAAAPEFVDENEAAYATGHVGSFFRSNGDAHGFDLGTTYVGQDFNLNYAASSAQSGNTTAAKDFKPAGLAAPGGEWLSGREIGSTAYKAQNQAVDLAWRRDQHLLQVGVAEQSIPYERYPNQRMDMTGNNSLQLHASYRGIFDWGVLDAHVFRQNVRHVMNMGPDRFSYGSEGMPMNTKARTDGGGIKASLAVSERQTVRTGVDYQFYRLDDWWPPAGGSMGPQAFWNVDNGRRDRVGLFGESETRWSPRWTTVIGVRHDQVTANAGPVQGYNGGPLWAPDAVAFNAMDRRRVDQHWDFSAMARFEADASQSYEAGFAHQTRSPNLYERYPWSTQPMATLMNNFVGDGNGYVGNPALKSEVANTLSLSGHWKDVPATGIEHWSVDATVYDTRVMRYIDARRCDVGQCGGAANVDATTGFVNLQYVNQSAEIQGADLSGRFRLFESSAGDRVTLKAMISDLRGRNRETGDGLYHMMPLDGRFDLVEERGAWTSTAELQCVAAKRRVSQVRNELPTPGYCLTNLRTSYQWRRVRVDAGVDNLFNRFYELPLGGAYVGQGATMSTGSVPWGVNLPGPGRSLNVGLTIRF